MVYDFRAGDLGRGERENGVEVTMRNRKGAYQASCLKDVEEKKRHHLRATGKHPQGTVQFRFK